MLPLPHHRFPLMTTLLIVANMWVRWQMALLPPLRQAKLSFEWGFIPVRLTRIDNPQPLRIRQPLGNPPQAMIELDLSHDATTV